LLTLFLGIVNFAPLKEHFLSLYKSTSVQLFTHPSLPSLCSYIGTPNQTPRLLFNLPSLVNQFKTVASRAFTDGKFSEAKRHFLNIIQSIPLVVVDSQQVKTNSDTWVNSNLGGV
jgi:coatomer protein complex subunit alpha (xenin)